MKKKSFFKFFVLAVIAVFVTVTSCKDYDDDINKVNNDLTALKSELNKKIDDKIAEINGTVTTLKTDLDKVKADLAKAITQEKLDEALAAYVKLEAFNTFKTDTETDLKNLKADLLKAATKEELEQLQTLLEGKITEAKNELGGKIEALETLLELKDGKLGVIEDIKEELGTQLGKINANAAAIKDLQDFLKTEYESLKEMDETLRGLIDKKVDIEVFNQAVKDINDEIEKQVKRLDGRINKLDADLNIERLRINSLFTFTRQLKGLTFIPTRGLPSEKTMKLYYYAGDYTAEHVFIYRVSPSNSLLGRDFTVESLNFQITTRSADDGVNDKSTEVDVHINPEGTYMVSGKEEMQKGIKQFGDILYVPVHIVGKEACKVFGNHDWWCNEFFFGPNKLWENNFPAHVVKTVKNPEVDYSCGYGWEGEKNSFSQNRGLSLVITTLAENIDKAEGEPAQIRIKSTEQVNTQLIPTQIKLAESRDGKGNQILDANLKERLLKFTLAEATNWAMEDESSYPNNNKNWNVQAWSGNENPDGWIPGSFDLNNFVTSFYYPQDGGDLTREDVVPGDPHRYLWAEFGKEFGKPYFDKPHYAKPIYEYELVAYEDGNHNIIIGTPESGSTHDYVSIDGSIISVHPTATAIQSVRNKKVIVKVTQVNSECPERQPVGYLVIKYTDKPVGKWDDVNFTYDMTNLPYYHKECDEFINGARIIKKDSVNTSSHGITFTHKDANLNLFTADRFMSPINSPQSYGISTATMNPGDIDHVIGEFPQINGIGEWSMGNIYNIQGQHVSIVPGSRKFTAATNNHVNDPENIAATGVTAEQALSHVMIRYEYSNHAYIIYVDDHAPAGDYEVTYKLENKVGNTQHGNVLYLTFKFRVALRDITVEHDKNTVNWLDDNKTIRVQHTRITNTIDEGHSPFRSDDGYRVDLREAFILKDGTIDIVTDTKPAIDGRNVGKVPSYNPKFEFIQDAKIKAAGFKYERDANNYLTLITLNGELAARIENDPADGFNYLYIKFNKAGDMLYNYLMQDMLASNDLTKHNVWTKWGKTELMKFDDMERLLPVRLVTDINATCANEDTKFPNGNYYYIDDFNIKFERALRWAFTTVEMTDNQQIQGHFFNFFTKDVHPTDESKSVYRGVFDHAYDLSHGYGNLVHPRWVPGMSITPYTFTNPFAQAWFYGLDSEPYLPTDDVLHPLEIDNVFGMYAADISGSYIGLDHSKVEVSTDGGNTWKPADQDYSVLAHNRRYFNVVQYYAQVNTIWGPTPVPIPIPVAIWQGNQTAITSPIYFRVPVTNGMAEELELNTDGNHWMSFRSGFAKIKGYAVFKINPRP